MGTTGRMGSSSLLQLFGFAALFLVHTADAGYDEVGSDMPWVAANAELWKGTEGVKTTPSGLSYQLLESKGGGQQV